MKTSFLLLIFLAAISCRKQDVFVRTETDFARNLLNDSTDTVFSDTVRIPLIDMDTFTYLGYHGGLYPDGTNVPSGIYAADLDSIVSTIAPLNEGGNVSSKGKIGFVAIGASTCKIMMNNLIKKTEGNTLTNPKLKLVTCTEGSTSINEIQDPLNSYWDTVNYYLNKKRLNAKQVQIAYVETDDSVETNGFPERPLRTKMEFQEAMRTLKTKFPNIKLVYLLGRTTAFVKATAYKVHNTEPCPYYNGWACKWVIEDQINGVPGTEYKGPNAVSPLVTWGWYEWANGTNVPRSDGFTWERADTKDGLHANTEGADTLSTYFQNFLLTDYYANKWYANHPSGKKGR